MVKDWGPELLVLMQMKRRGYPFSGNLPRVLKTKIQPSDLDNSYLYFTI